VGHDERRHPASRSTASSGDERDLISIQARDHRALLQSTQEPIMTQITRPHSLRPEPFDELTGPFSDRGAQVAVALLAILLGVTLLGLGVAYYGDSYAVPSWNEHSVPAPKLY
jgi:hypothetical protein